MKLEEAVDRLARSLPDAPPEALQRLAVALGGHALAMELAARRVQRDQRPGEDDAARLERCICEYEAGILAGSPFDRLKLEQGEATQDNLTRSLAYSYDDLDPDDQAHFRALGVLAYDAPFDAALLAALWEQPLETVYGTADRLRLLSLLDVDGSGYRQHPLLRAYARALLEAAGETDAVFDRYTDAVTELTRQFEHLPLDQWHTLTPHIPHIHAVGDALADCFLSTKTPSEALTGRVGWFSWNTCVT